MKYLSVLIFCSSCALFDGAKDAFTGTYEFGKARGRAEVLNELHENKKKLDELKAGIVMAMAQEASREEDFDPKRLKMLITPLTAYLMLLNERGKFLEELNVISLESVDE